MQQAAFNYCNLDLHYEAWETEATDLRKVLGRVRQASTLGANVTVPHKEVMGSLMDELDDLALEIGAVNTIVNRGGQLVGYNTDAGGFLRALQQEGDFSPAGKRVVLLGAGGVARAVSFALAREGVKSLVITDIIAQRAHALASDLESVDSGISISVEEHFAEALPPCDLVVNCTPVGMRHSATEGQSPLDAGLIPKEALVYDVVYNPVETPLLMDAKKAGARTLGGLAMLVYQGALAFELWTDREAPIDIMFEAAKQAL